MSDTTVPVRVRIVATLAGAWHREDRESPGRTYCGAPIGQAWRRFPAEDDARICLHCQRVLAQRRDLVQRGGH